MGTICTMAAAKQTTCFVYPPFNSSFFKESLLSKASTIANAPSLFISSKDKFSSFKLFTEVRKLLANALAPSVLTRQSPKLMTSRFLRLGSTYKTSTCYKSTWFLSIYIQKSITTPESVLESGKITRNFLRQHLKDLARVVQTLDSAINRINHYPVDSVIGFHNTYPLDSDLSGG